MKVSFIRENFLKAASLTVQVVGLKPSLPVLNNFMLSAETGFLELVATNLETTITYKIPVKVLDEGKTTVPARALIDFCQAVRSSQINLETEKENLLIQAESSRASIPTMSPSEFPKASKFESTTTLSINKSKFLEGVSQVAFSAAPEEGRPVLTGVLVKPDGEKINLVATDGYRLAEKEIKGSGKMESGVLIPSRALREGAKAIAEQEDESIEMSVNKEKNQIQLETKNLTILSRLLEGDYPNFEQIIPASFVAEIIADTQDLVNSVKLAALFAKEVGNVVKLSVEGSSLIISASTAQVGEAQTSLSVKHKGEDLKTAFNSRFLLESLGTIKDKEIIFNLSGSTSAALLRGNQDASLTHIVMPVRAQS
ncbi:MAG TPA: DNA polymerase III subunit beta [Candidatus Nanoarchaeia archaeon]